LQAITIVVLKLHHMGKHDNHYMLPHWARVFFLKQCAWFVGMSKYITLDIEQMAKLRKEPRDPISKFETSSSSSAAGQHSEEKRGQSGGVLAGLDNFVRRMSSKSYPQTAQQDRNTSNSCNRNESDSYTRTGTIIGGEEEDVSERLCHMVSGSGLCEHTKLCEHCHTHCEPAYAGIRHKHKLNTYQLQRKLDTGAYSYTVCCCACMREALEHKPWAQDLVPLKPSLQRSYMLWDTNNNNSKDTHARKRSESNINDKTSLDESSPVEPKWSRVRATVLMDEGDEKVMEFASARQRRLEEARMRANTGRWSIESVQFNKHDVQEYLLLKIYKKLAEHKERLSDEDIEAEIRCEWMQLAMVLDRLMFIIYIVGTIIILIRMAVLLHLKKSSLIAIASEHRG
jgi:hypothetical protein